MNPKDIRDAKVSETVRNLNPHLFGVDAIRPKIRQQKAQRPLDRESSGHEARAPGLAANRPHIRVSLVYFCKRKMDSHDNLRLGYKGTADSIAASLGIDDSLIEWEYHQCLTQGQPGTAVKIDITPN